MTKQQKLTKYLHTLLIVVMGFGVFVPLFPVQAATQATVADFSAAIDQANDFQFQGAMAIDQESGQILYQYQADQQLGIASLSKVISLGVVYDAIKQGTLKLTDTVPISTDVALLSQTEGLSNVPLEVSKDRYTVGELIDAAMIASANAAVVALAERVAGSEDGFVTQQMSDKVKDAGVKNFKLYSASGLPGNYVNSSKRFFDYTENNENQLSATDYLRVARQIVTEYPDILTRSLPLKKDFKVNADTTVTMENQNEMIPGGAHGRHEVTGGKTGTGDISGYSLLVQANLSGRKVLVVTLGDPTKEARYQDMERLLDSIENQLSWYRIHGEGDMVGGSDAHIPVANGDQPWTSLYYEKEAGLFVPNTQLDDPGIEVSYRDALQYDTEGKIQVIAPLKKDAVVNVEYYTAPFYQSIMNDKEHQSVSDAVKATEDVLEVPFFVKISRLMNDIMQNLMQWLHNFFATVMSN